jgi:hypothetical protein
VLPVLLVPPVLKAPLVLPDLKAPSVLLALKVPPALLALPAPPGLLALKVLSALLQSLQPLSNLSLVQLVIAKLAPSIRRPMMNCIRTV